MGDNSRWRIGLGKAVGAQHAQHFLVSLDRAGEHHLVLASAAADAMDQVIDLINERGDQRMHLGGEMMDELAKRGIFGLGDGGGETAYGLFAMLPHVVSAA